MSVWLTHPELACWQYGVGPRDALQALDAGTLDAFLDALVARLVALLEDFAHPAAPLEKDSCHSTDLYLSTHGGRQQGAPALQRALHLDLDCLDVEGRALTIEGGATLRLKAWLRADGGLELRRMHPLELTLAVHVDIAAPLPDRGPLARLNGPRLSGFLRRLEREVPAELFGIEAPGYEKLAAPCGFHEEDKIGRAC